MQPIATAIDVDEERLCRLLPDGSVVVKNDGPGIPVHVHQKEKMYVPELILGNLLTGSNFTDAAQSTTGGRHDYGAKLTNIFRRRFKSTLSTRGAKEIHQDLARQHEGICARRYLPSSAKPYTAITFKPDWSQFDVSEWDEGSKAVAVRRVHDLAGCFAGSLRVTLDGEDISKASFADYCKMYQPDIVHRKINASWEVAVAATPR